jgi:CheY-like chemotaxis protein
VAALLAHELNNPLTVLQLRTDLLVEDAPSVATKDQLDLLVQALGRMTRAVRTFQRVARAPRPTSDPVLVAELVDRAVAEAEAAARVQLDPVAPGFVVRGDEDALSLALEVLLRSGTEAGPARVKVEGFNHTVRVEILAEAGPPSAAAARRAARPVDESSEVLAHAVASLIARDHGGEVRTSERGGAAVLQLELPRAVEGAEVNGRQPARLLVVDDEPLVAAVLADWCLRNGHACRVAGSAEEAMAALTGSDAFDAVLIDERLPGASGVELLGFLEREVPSLLGRAALMSGSAPTTSARYAFLPKPFTRRQLADLIETLLAR